MRVAIISTPRSGNSWVREVLGEVLRAESVAVHNYRDAPSRLPERCLLQLHWYREPNFQQYLADNDFRVVTLARHPIDVLISVLAFIRHEPLTQRWLEGNVAIPQNLSGKGPTSPAFLDYALSYGAENLLCVSYQWWHHADAIRLRYEDLVAAPFDTFARVLGELGYGTEGLEAALSAKSFDYFQRMPNQHGWKGRPGLWRDIVTPIRARRIRERHRAVFDALDYRVAPKLWLANRRAEANWTALA